MVRRESLSFLAPAAAILFLAVVLLAPPAASQEVARLSIVDAPPGTPGIGGGLRLSSNPYKGGMGQVDLVPLYFWEGRFLFAHGTSAGLHAVRTEHFGIDLFARYRFLELDPEGDAFDEEVVEGLHKREQTADGGVAIKARGGWGEVRAAWLTDLESNHQGEEYELSYRARFERGPFIFSPYVELSRWDEDLADYYFGVDADEVREGRPEYTPGATLNWGLGLNTTFVYRERGRFFLNLGYERLGSEIADSPLVARPYTLTAFLGGAYHFGNVAGAATPDPQREHEWSWRVNYGYQAHGNIVGDIDQGDWTKSKYADTNLGGVTLSKLLIDGPRIDFYGRFALYRHFEEPYQDDFFSFNPYIMAMGKGRLPWSDTTAFRWGFGFGCSYAQSIPAEEQIKGELKDRQTAQFINYLEMTLDFPLALATKAKPLRNCYVGLTTAHRSGIFSTSDMLSNVYGGSDWLTLHLECLR
jgi:outer membrane scaffolding protein for murein synthesis (MipA/OmpV family)